MGWLPEKIDKLDSIEDWAWDSKKKFIYVETGGFGEKKNPRDRIQQHRSGRRSRN